MATDTIERDSPFDSDDDAPSRASPLVELRAIGRNPLRALASLKLTVILLAMSIVIVFSGTLAQIDKDVWEVVHQYFRTPFAWIEFQIFFPRTFHVPWGFYFPSGFIIVPLMAVNLLAAHAVRFKVQAKGARLAVGLTILAIGAGLTWWVVAIGSDKETLSGASTVHWEDVHWWIKGGLAALVGAIGYAFFKLDAGDVFKRALVGAALAGLTTLLIWLLVQGGDVVLNDSSMRILWQLFKGGFAGLVLLLGSVLAFRKRAGVVLLHAGVALLMANELIVYMLHSEAQMTIKEKDSANFVQDIRTVELALTRSVDDEETEVAVVPKSRLLGSEVLRDERLPVDVEVVQFLQNAALRRAKADDANRATAGDGLAWIAEEKPAGVGTDTNAKVDLSAAYVKLFAKSSSEPLGTWMVTIGRGPQRIRVGDREYEVALRFKRTCKPYIVKLIDVVKKDYPGTNTPREYSSRIHLVDPSRNVDRRIKIWMNNPLRYAGETFYQSGYDRDPVDGREVTTLQVVKNAGWMLPYVACMIVLTGMLAHFSIVLVRFLNRRNALAVKLTAIATRPIRQRRKKAAEREPMSGVTSDLWGSAFPLAVVLVAATWVGLKAIPPKAPAGEMQLYEFGKLPVQFEGRTKALDTLARNSMMNLSGRQTWTDAEGKSQPAIKWLLDIMASSSKVGKAKVFRIDNLEVLDLLGLERREGFRYSYDEFEKRLGEFADQVEAARKVETGQLSTYQDKVLELDRKLELVGMLLKSFAMVPPDRQDVDQARMQAQLLSGAPIPRVVPPLNPDDEQWRPLSAVWMQVFDEIKNKRQMPDDDAARYLLGMVMAYSKGDAGEFNRMVAEYRGFLETHSFVNFNLRKASFEAFFNHLEPFYCACALYAIAFVLAAVGWLGWSRPLQNASFWLIALTLLLHTLALSLRIYISGRPPVTNLYSSAVFIGWGAVVFGLKLELLDRLGIGNVVAAIAGFATLLIAHNLAAGGSDTFTVLQAVLDTQIWLATHVVCITMGYTATLVAGLLGALYIIVGTFTTQMTPTLSKILARKIYGMLCFAILFSFVGTVLGGLWADDSWGRFWGWDPKENGALMIVLWNALVLHARWDGLVKERGLAALAVFGNITVSWSWFGVNQLGAGLHSYGFTSGIAQALGTFILSQLAIIVLALFVRRRRELVTLELAE